jgi:hypothetical protein
MRGDIVGLTKKSIGALPTDDWMAISFSFFFFW